MRFSKKYINIVLLFLVSSFDLFSNDGLVINEVFPAPETGSVEWVEIYNNSLTDIDYPGAWINDSKTSKIIVEFSLKSYHYAIFCKDTSLFLDYWTKSDSCILIETKLPGFNNDWDVVVLRNADSIMVDSMFYAFDTKRKGTSLERIDPNLQDFELLNWEYCISESQSTPGKWNSVSRSVVDIAVKKNDDKNNLIIYLKKGEEAIIDSISFSLDLNNDGVYSENERFYNTSINQQITDSLILNINTPKLFEQTDLRGDLFIQVIVYSEDDIDNTNNEIRSWIYNPISSDALTINELLYDVDENNGEFVEIYNKSEFDIVLNGIYIRDRYKQSGFDSVTFNYPSPIIKSQEYVVLLWDSSFYNTFPELLGNTNVFCNEKDFNLNYYGDDILLVGADNVVLDSLTYLHTWHTSEFDTKNISLEKINPNLISSNKNSWNSSSGLRGATPVEKNSCFQHEMTEGTLIADPNPFSPFGTRESNCIVHFELPFENATVDISIYTESGGVIRKFNGIKVSNAKADVVWNGRNDEGFLVDIGPYVLILNAMSIDNKQYTDRMLIVVGK